MVVILLSFTAMPAGATVTEDTGPPGPAVPPAGAGGGAGTNLQFNLTYGPGITALQGSDPGLAAQVTGGFTAAGNLWSAWFNDNITINVSVDYTGLPAGTINSASNNTEQANFANIKPALIGDATTANDNTAIANLQPGNSLDFIMNDTGIPAAPRIRDNNGSANNWALDVPRGNLKALGIRAANDPAEDGAITLSSGSSWDFDSSDGIDAGKFDFVGVAAHEIGHIMGFVSGVNIVDLVGGAGPFAPVNLNNFRVFSVLDLYRYSDDSLTADGQPANGAVLDLAYGDTPFFSIDAGATNLGTFSTGSYNGDGRECSHWKHNVGLGILDPTAALGETLVISDLDLQALDVIGYDLIPEPATMSLLGLGALALVRRRRRA
jgi:hypothetical protein